MANEAERAALSARLDTIEKDIANRVYSPLIEKARVLGNVGDLESARGVLAMLDKLKVEVEAERFTQPNWQVGTVINAANMSVNIGPIREAIEEILKHLRPPQEVIQVDVVLAIMTAADAADLHSGAAFATVLPLQAEFKLLHDYFVQQAVDDWTAHYGASARDWRPFDDPDIKAPTIEAHITSALEQMRKNLGIERPLLPRFQDIGSLSANQPELKRLRSAGCLLVIDSVSLRHPRVLRDLQRSLLDVYPRSSVFAFSPSEGVRPLLADMTYALELKLRDSELVRRIEDPFEDIECHDISSTAGAVFKKAMVKSVKTLYGPQFTASTTRSHFNKV